MTCQNRDEDLLLLAHRELPVLSRLATEAHLRRCPRCRERREEWAAVSGLLAGAIRDRHHRPWSAAPAGPAVRPAFLWRRRITAFALVVLLAVLGAMAHFGVAGFSALYSSSGGDHCAAPSAPTPTAGRIPPLPPH